MKKQIIKFLYGGAKVIMVSVLLATMFFIVFSSFFILGDSFTKCLNVSEKKFELGSSELMVFSKNYVCVFLFLFLSTASLFLIGFNVIFPIDFKIKESILKLEKKWGIYKKKRPFEKQLAKHKDLSLKRRVIFNVKMLFKLFLIFI